MEETSKMIQSSSIKSFWGRAVFVGSWFLIVLKLVNITISHMKIVIICGILNRWKNFISVIIINFRTSNIQTFFFILSQFFPEKPCTFSTFLLSNVLNNLIDWHRNIENLVVSEFYLNSTLMCVMKSGVNVDILPFSCL